MLAQLFLTPSGMTLDVTLAAAVAVAAAAPVAVELQLSCAGSSVAFGASQDDSPDGAVSHAVDSTVGVEVSTVFSLRTPFVGARPRPPLPPRSVARPRPPLAPSNPARPPRETLDWLVESPKDVTVVASLTLDLDRSFLLFETSPH